MLLLPELLSLFFLVHLVLLFEQPPLSDAWTVFSELLQKYTKFYAIAQGLFFWYSWQMKSKPTTPIPVRISNQTLKELKRISVEQDRAVGWLIRFACDFLVDAYKKDPDIVGPHVDVDRLVQLFEEKPEWLKALIAEMKAKLPPAQPGPPSKLPGPSKLDEGEPPPAGVGPATANPRPGPG